MPNTCGYAVLATSTNGALGAGLYPGALQAVALPEHKSSTFPLLCTQVVRLAIHCFSRPFTAVTTQFIPTIHTTNKNYKKFYTNNLLLIERKAVHI